MISKADALEFLLRRLLFAQRDVLRSLRRQSAHPEKQDTSDLGENARANPTVLGCFINSNSDSPTLKSNVFTLVSGAAARGGLPGRPKVLSGICTGLRI